VKKTFWILFLAQSYVALGATVLSVGARDEFVITTNEASSKPWNVNDNVCLLSGAQELACGYIAQLTPTKLGIKLVSAQSRMVRGQTVQLKGDARQPANTSPYTLKTSVLKSKESPILDISTGMIAGLSYFYPMVHLQVNVMDTVGLGVMGSYFNSTDSLTTVSGYGGFVTLNYYHTHFPFRGLFFQFAGGMYPIEITSTLGAEKVQPFALMGSVQWRGKAYWGLPFDIGVGLGAQYISSTTTNVVIDFKGILPMLSLFLGYSF